MGKTRKYNFRNVKPHTWVSLAMLVLVIINSILGALGKPLIQFSEESVTVVVTAIMDLVFIFYAAYKNQSVTVNAQMADEVLYMLRDGKITKEELDNFINKFQNPDRPQD